MKNSKSILALVASEKITGKFTDIHQKVRKCERISNESKKGKVRVMRTQNRGGKIVLEKNLFSMKIFVVYLKPIIHCVSTF